MQRTERIVVLGTADFLINLPVVESTGKSYFRLIAILSG
jgi:hypothetical protein